MVIFLKILDSYSKNWHTFLVFSSCNDNGYVSSHDAVCVWYREGRRYREHIVYIEYIVETEEYN